MTEKQLRKMSRLELVELLYRAEKEKEALRQELRERIAEKEKEKETLQQEINELKAALENREMKLRKAGSIAEAALSLNGVFEAAQQAADDYLRNLYETGERIEQQRNALLEQTALECRRRMEEFGFPSDSWEQREQSEDVCQEPVPEEESSGEAE